MTDVKCADCEEYRNEWCEKIIDSPHPDMLRDCPHWHERMGANIGEQINMCLHDLNILHDMVAADRADHWDVDWQMDQIEHAKICIERLKGDGEE